MKLSNICAGILIFIKSLAPVLVFGQEQNLSESIINIAENLTASDPDPEAATYFIERLYELAEDPVMINSSNEKEINRLFFLSDFQVKAIIDYISSSGNIVSLYELANIPGFDKEIVEQMIPFITLEETVKKDSPPGRFMSTMLTNFSIKPGNSDSLALGSQWKFLSKYKFSKGNFSGGLTTEKDPGESFYSKNTNLPEFFSAHLAYNGKGVIRRLIIGDYSVRFGQGTTINSGIRTALSLSSPGYMSARDEIKPYTSTDENNFFRGLATEFNIKNAGLTFFYSKNYSDATLGTYPSSSDFYIESFYKSGIHNTSSLLEKKDIVSETATGANMAFNFSFLKVGVVWLNTSFSLPVNPENQKPSDIFDFKGDHNNTLSFYYNTLIKKILLFGELSVNEESKYALVQGVSFRPSDRLSMNWLYRNYKDGFNSFHGNGPGISASEGNEHGLLANFNFEAARHLFISGGCDLYYFPWMRYRTSSPSMGKKAELRIRYLPVEELIVEASYTSRVTMTDNSVTKGIPSLNKQTSKTLKVSARYFITGNLSLTSRSDYKITNYSGSKGMLLLQDIKYSFRSIPVTIWARYCIFNTSDWESRLYAYENDLLYSFSIPALSGDGSRSYILVKCSLSDYADVRIKYGVTSQNNGAYETDIKNEFKMQFKLRF